MSRFDQQMREVERSLAQLGGKTQATKIRKDLEKKIQLAAAKKLPEFALSLVKSGRADDQGVFVLLDPMMPSRLAGAFPEGVEVRRLGLAEAVQEVAAFLKP